MGYREPHDYRKPSCFSRSDNAPDCRSVKPFDYQEKVGVDTVADKVELPAVEQDLGMLMNDAGFTWIANRVNNRPA